MFAKLRNISDIAFPIMVSNLALITSILINTSILGNYNELYFYYLALFMPVNYILMAIYETFRITSLGLCQVAAFSKESFLSYIYRLMFITAVVLSVLILICYSLRYLHINLALNQRHESLFLYFVLSMLFAGLFISLNSIINGSLYAIGKQKTSLLIVIATSVLVCAFNLVLLKQFHFGMFSLSVAMIVINSIMVIIGIFLLRIFEADRETIDNASKTLNQTINYLTRVGVPIFLVYVVIFVSLVIYNVILAHFGKNIVSAFSIVFKIQNFVMIPGVAFGVSVGIIINKLVNEGDAQRAYEYLKYAFILSIIFYFVFSLIIFMFREYIVGVIVSDSQIRMATIDCMKYYSFAFTGLGPCLMFICVLEQTGHTLKSLFINIAIFAIQIMFGGYISLAYGDQNTFYIIAIVVNTSGMFYVLYEILYNKKYINNLSKLLVLRRGG